MGPFHHAGVVEEETQHKPALLVVNEKMSGKLAAEERELWPSLAFTREGGEAASGRHGALRRAVVESANDLLRRPAVRLALLQAP